MTNIIVNCGITVTRKNLIDDSSFLFAFTSEASTKQLQSIDYFSSYNNNIMKKLVAIVFP